MKLRFYLILGGMILGFCFMRCASTRSPSHSATGDPEKPYPCHLSPFTSFFLSDLQKIIPVGNISDSFIPPETLRRKYGIIRLSDGRYGICGFTKFRDSLPENQLEQKGIQLSDASAGFSTVCLPLSGLDFFLHLQEISYFAISTPVK